MLHPGDFQSYMGLVYESHRWQGEGVCLFLLQNWPWKTLHSLVAVFTLFYCGTTFVSGGCYFFSESPQQHWIHHKKSWNPPFFLACISSNQRPATVMLRLLGKATSHKSIPQHTYFSFGLVSKECQEQTK